MNNQKEGVFWVIEGKLYAYPFGSVDSREAITKTNATYNHKKLWNELNLNVFHKPYNYYPRGRVVINSRGKVIIYMNHNICFSMIKEIKEKFNLVIEPRIIYDGSTHYRCHLDKKLKRRDRKNDNSSRF